MSAPVSPHPDPDPLLLARAIEGDRAALAELLKIFGPLVRARIAPKISAAYQSMIEPDDVMQVTYVEAFMNVVRFRPGGPGSFLAWLSRIAENNLLDAVKEMQRAKRPDPRRRVGGAADESYTDLVEVLGVTTTTPSRIVAVSELRGVMDFAIEKLPKDYATIIRMYDLAGHGIAEVARELGKSEGATYMMLARARERLAEVLGSESKYFSRKS